MEEGGGENDSDFIPFNSTNDKETELIQPGSKRQKLVNSITVPWFSRDGRTTLERRAPPLVRLHNEILTFCQFITPTPAEMKIREKTLSDVTAIIKAKWPDCSVKVFGSQLTKILTPNSDLDIAVLDVPSNIDLPEAMVDLALKIRQQMKVSYIEPVVNARVPILKFDHVDSGLSVDICINLDSGLRTGHMLVQLQKDYPPLLPLTLVLKTFLGQRRLNDTYTGGVGSFLLSSLVLSFLQMKVKLCNYTDMQPNWNLGSLLLEFFFHYGVTFNYYHTGISITDSGKYFPKAIFGKSISIPAAADKKSGASNGGNTGTANNATIVAGNNNNNTNTAGNDSRPGVLCVENPDSPDVDMGRNSYLMNKVKRAFEHSYQLLVVALNDNALHSYLGYVIRGDDPTLTSRVNLVRK